MRTTTRMAVALAMVGAVVSAAAAFGQHGGGDEGAGPGPAPSGLGPRKAGVRGGERVRGEDGPIPGRHARRCGPHRPQGAAMWRGGKRLVHSETKVQHAEGFALILVDVGEVTAVDHPGKTLTLGRADGEEVTVTAGEQTRVCKDGHPASFDAIQVGDAARVVRRVVEGETVVRGIAAHSPPQEPAPGADVPAAT